MRGESYCPVPYPTDKSGLPIHPYELGFTPSFETEEKTNNHHLAFFARAFGRTAIGVAFRNLETNQTQMVIPEHVTLHQRYTGFKVPRHNVMLDRISEDFEDGGFFKVYNQVERAYELIPITEEEMQFLERTYREDD